MNLNWTVWGLPQPHCCPIPAPGRWRSLTPAAGSWEHRFLRRTIKLTTLGTLRTLFRENEKNTWVFSTQLDPCRHSVSEAARCVKFQVWFCELTLRAARISHTHRYDHACFLLGLTSRKFRGNRSAFISSPHARHRHFVT